MGTGGSPPWARLAGRNFPHLPPGLHIVGYLPTLPLPESRTTRSWDERPCILLAPFVLPLYLERLRDLLDPVAPRTLCARRAESFNEGVVHFRHRLETVLRAHERGQSVKDDVVALLSLYAGLAAEREALITGGSSHGRRPP